MDLNFPGTSRFVIEERLGQGGMGVVYRAFDRERETNVALKCLREVDSAAIIRLKREFRVARDLLHPNLVALGELVEDGGHWFFTMELVEGSSLLEYVRPGMTAFLERTQPRPTDPTVTRIIPAGGENVAPMVQEPELAELERAPVADEARLRSVLAQLAQGVAALHTAGLVHLDIKPGNILVSKNGRVVLLDFGISQALTSVCDGEARSPTTVGTPLYMAPEQCRGERPGPAADWYAFGMVMHYLLIGRRPLRGTDREIIDFKAKFDMAAPSEFISRVPPDLDALCVELLRRDPEARPRGRDVTLRLGASPQPALPSAASNTPAALFIGRERELAQLHRAFARSRAEGTVAVLVEGASGLGKSALVQRAVTALEEQEPRLLLLQGRCHEREAVPFKAFDGVLDALAEALGREPQESVPGLLPEHMDLLAQVFPVLAPLAASAGTLRDAPRVWSRPEARRLAFVAMRELLTKVSQTRPVVVVIDDLHWADPDSLRLLKELLRARNGPRMLLLATTRPQGPRDARSVEPGVETLAAAFENLLLEPLTAEQARALVTALHRGLSGDAEGLQTILSEAGGHPFFLHELVRHAHESPVRRGVLKLDDALDARTRGLDWSARTLLELVAIAGRPLPNEAFAHASGLDADAFGRAVSTLRHHQFVRTHGMRRKDALEPYHDRVRETVAARVAPEARPALHRQLALALERTQTGDPETLAIHWEGAGDGARAAAYTEKAAYQADATLAFVRAARLFQHALELDPGASRERKATLQRLIGDAWANGGHNAEAAAAYLAASEATDGAAALNLGRLAAEKYMQSGLLEKGLPQLQRVLGEMGMKLRPTPRHHLLPILGQRLRVAWRGVKYTARQESEIPAEELVKLDIAATATATLSLLDPIGASEYSTAFFLRALESGVERRISRALAHEFALVSAVQKRETARSRKLYEQAETLARRLDEPLALAYCYFQRAAVRLTRDGDMEATYEDSVAAEQLFRSRCQGVAWELGSTCMFTNSALWFMGRWAEMSTRVRRERADALEHGDYYSAAHAGSAGLNSVYLLADAPDEALAVLRHALGPFVGERFYLVHSTAMVAEANVSLYTGEPQKGLALFDQNWKRLQRSLLLELPIIHFITWETRARCEIAAAQLTEGAERERHLGRALRYASALNRSNFPWARYNVLALQAGVASVRGDRHGAATRLREAADGLHRHRIYFYENCVRHVLGFVGEVSEREGAERARAKLAGEGILRPERIVQAFVPGFLPAA